jgi:hypothetical protein
MDRIQLSRNFFLDEFTRSEVAARLGRPVRVEPDSEIHENLTRLCAMVLQPLRDALGPVFITSGYRPAWLNKRIGGGKHSQHILGLAADIVVTGHSPHDVGIHLLREALPYDQLIYEFGEWVHVSVAPPFALARAEVLTAVKRPARVPGVKPRTEYVRGLWHLEELEAVA